MRATFRATAVDGFGVRWRDDDPDATAARARASVAIAREEERTGVARFLASACARGETCASGRSCGERRPQVVLGGMATSACARRAQKRPSAPPGRSLGGSGAVGHRKLLVCASSLRSFASVTERKRFAEESPVVKVTPDA